MRTPNRLTAARREGAVVTAIARGDIAAARSRCRNDASCAWRAPAARLLCAACERRFPGLPPRARSARCLPTEARSAERASRIRRPSPRRSRPFAYAFPTDRLLQRIKYGGRIALAEWAGAALASAVRVSLAGRSAGERPGSHRARCRSRIARQRERGFNQAREIAVHVARRHRVAARGAARARLPQVRRRPRSRGRERAAQCPRRVRGAGGRARSAHRARRRRHDHRRHARRGFARTLVAAGAQRVECWVVARTLPP